MERRTRKKLYNYFIAGVVSWELIQLLLALENLHKKTAPFPFRNFSQLYCAPLCYYKILFVVRPYTCTRFIRNVENFHTRHRTQHYPNLYWPGIRNRGMKFPPPFFNALCPRLRYSNSFSAVKSSATGLLPRWIFFRLQFTRGDGNQRNGIDRWIWKTTN